MWFLEPESGGSVTSLAFAFSTSLPQAVMIDIWGRPWSYAACQLRCIGGICVRVAKWGAVNITACGIGGLDGGEMHAGTGEWVGVEEEGGAGHSCVAAIAGSISGHPARAAYGLRLQDRSEVQLENSVVEFTGLRGAGLQACDGSSLGVESCEIRGNSVGVTVERDTNVLVANSRFFDNDLASFFASSFSSKGASVTLRNNSISGKVWLNRRRPRVLTEAHVFADGAVTNESRWERVRRLEKERSDGLDLDDDVDIHDPLLQGWRAEEEDSMLRQAVSSTKVGEFARWHAWQLEQQENYDPCIHELGTNWPPPVDKAYLESPVFTRLFTDKGQEEAEHSFWRGAGFPAGVLPPGPDEVLQETGCESDAEDDSEQSDSDDESNEDDDDEEVDGQ